MSSLWKICIIGDPIKEKIRIDYLGKGFPSNYGSIIGVEFALSEIIIDEKNIKLQFWDIISKSKSRREFYLSDALGIIVVYETKDQNKLIQIQGWVNGAITQNKRQFNRPIVILGYSILGENMSLEEKEKDMILEDIDEKNFSITFLTLDKGKENQQIVQIKQILAEAMIKAWNKEKKEDFYNES